MIVVFPIQAVMGYKPSRFELDGKKWVVEFFRNKPDIVIDDAEPNQSV